MALLQYPEATTDKATGQLIPREFVTNLKARQFLTELCEKDPSQREIIMGWCEKSPVYWMNLWAWTYRVKEVGPDGREIRAEVPQYPFITWPVQDNVLETITRNIDQGRDCIVHKSRDMGATWICLMAFLWMWLFKRDTHLLLVSRNEEAVEKRGDPDCLYWKLDWTIGCLPQWMRPRRSQRSERHLGNLDRCNTIDGASTTGSVGQGGRRTAILMDEFARVPDGYAMLTATADVTPCRIFNSTPNGPGTAYSELHRLSVESGTPELLSLMYYDHPQKGRGRETRIDDEGKYTFEKGKQFIWTPWLEQEIKRRKTKREVSENIMASHDTSGQGFFDSNAISEAMSVQAVEPTRCDIVPMENSLGGMMLTPDPKGNWFVFREDCINRVPPEDRNYVVGADIASGNGSSNSVLAVIDRENGQLVAEYVDPNIPPYELADVALKTCRHVFHGQGSEAFLIWEVNGPGEGWFKELQRVKLSFVYYARAEADRGEKRRRTYGWRSTRTSKELRLRHFNAMFMRGEVIIKSKVGLREMLQYVSYDDGGIGPGVMRDETTNARAAHGDRVIAYMLAAYGMAESPMRHEPPKPKWRSGTYGELMGRVAELNKFQEEKKKNKRDPFALMRLQPGKTYV